MFALLVQCAHSDFFFFFYITNVMKCRAVGWILILFISPSVTRLNLLEPVMEG